MLKSEDATASDVEIDLTRGGATAKIGEGTATVPEGSARQWEIKKVELTGTSATGQIKIEKTTPGNIGAITDIEYIYEGGTVPAGTSKVYDVEIQTTDHEYKVKIQVTVKN